MSMEEPSTRVTLKQVYDLALETKEAVINLPDRVQDHEVRIRSLEKTIYRLIWVGATGGGLAGIIQIINAVTK